MVYLRVAVVWAACEHDAVSACLFEILKYLFSLFVHIFTNSLHFKPALMCCCFYLSGRDTVFFPEEIHKTLCKYFLTLKRDKRILVFYLIITQFLNIVFYIFTVGCDDRAVVVVSSVRHFDTLIRNTRVEYVFKSLSYKPCNMTVCEFCRITFRLTWNRLDTEFINLSA
ncbi:unknown [Clostridium sp. CAG:122]|nr:unknown [Clostridium sp. CAG:122]